MRYITNPDGTETRVRYPGMELDYLELAHTQDAIRITSGDALDPLLRQVHEVRERIALREEEAAAAL